MSYPRPVLTSASITGLVQGSSLIAAFLGYSNISTNLNGEAQGITAFLIGLVTLGGNIIHGLHAEGKVTPVEALETAAKAIQPVVTPDVAVAQQIVREWR